MTSSHVYKLRVENRALTGWQDLLDAYPDEMAEIRELLKTQPTNTRITNGKGKKLKGKLKGILQYDVTYSDRIRYEVDKNNKIVSILYAGEHP